MSTLRIPFFILTAGLALFAPIPAFLMSAALYLLWYQGLELLIIGVIIDALFGVRITDVVYTLSIGALLILATLVRPYMSWYTEA